MVEATASGDLALFVPPPLSRLASLVKNPHLKPPMKGEVRCPHCQHGGVINKSPKATLQLLIPNYKKV